MVLTYGPGFHRLHIDRVQREVDSRPQVDCPARWIRSPGIRAREITIPAGVVLIGAVHRVENIAVLSKGRMILATVDGPLEISAPATLIVKPGQKNACTAIEECVWTNFWRSDEDDMDKFVEQISESKASDLIGGATNKQLGNMKEPVCLSD